MGGFIDLSLIFGMERQCFMHNTRIKSYPSGRTQILACDREVFGGKGWEKSRGINGLFWTAKDDGSTRRATRKPKGEGAAREPKDVARSVRRARAQVRDYALCTEFKYFVTLTLDKAKVDRYDVKEITKKLRVWADNQVRRKGLTYILVPERHKDGAIHFHGFFNGALEAVDSGTMTMAGWKAPRRPRSAAQRREWEAKGAHPVYNLPAWTLGFTTAIELYGSYDAAVSYVCKYIGKDMGGGSAGAAGEVRPAEKIGGRWYYSGGDLRLPEVTYCDSSLRDLESAEGAYSFSIPDAGLSFVLINVMGVPCNDKGTVERLNQGDRSEGGSGCCEYAPAVVGVHDRAGRRGRAGGSPEQGNIWGSGDRWEQCALLMPSERSWSAKD